eukprot:12533951-Alexandrium_andersonii.AAC.1
MSASLVGSEMCIRDSRIHHGRLRGSVGRAVCRAVGTMGRAMVATPWPVSYTHLTLPTICSV